MLWPATPLPTYSRPLIRGNLAELLSVEAHPTEILCFFAQAKRKRSSLGSAEWFTPQTGTLPPDCGVQSSARGKFAELDSKGKQENDPYSFLCLALRETRTTRHEMNCRLPHLLGQAEQLPASRLEAGAAAPDILCICVVLCLVGAP